MTDETSTDTAEPAVATDRIEVALAYRGSSQVVARDGRSTVALCANTYRTPVSARGRIVDPLRMREALGTLHDIVGSDFRYKPKDRTAYLAFQRMKKSSASLDAWQAQQQYYEWLQRNDPDAWTALDPVVTAHPDELFVEVFSRDEGTYARLAVDWSALELDGDTTFGTTNIDFGDSLVDGLARMRSYKDSWLQLGPEAATVGDGEAPPEVAKSLRLPSSWLRGFLQVQSSATLPRSTFSMEPIDLYNALRWLRLNADVKRKGRAMRIELVPGEPVRIVLEPWEDQVFTCGGPVYGGKKSEVVRIWGRRRLMLLRRLLPFVESVDVHVLGSGLPSFWVLRAGAYTMTVALTGFTASNWSRAISFDLLLPRSSIVTKPQQKVLDVLAKKHFASLDDLKTATKLKPAEVFEALQQGAQQGKVAYDIDRDVFRIRPVSDAPLDLVRLEFRNDRERLAHDLVAEKGAVKIVEENRIVGVGVEIVGKVAVAADKREYRASMLIGDDGRVLKADDTSEFFRQHGLKEGPSVPLIALRLAWAREEARRDAARGSERERVTVETRTYSRRDPRGEDVVQVALDKTKLKVRWGRRGQRQRLQQMRFNDVADARAAYFERVERLEADGYLDASAAS